MMAQRRFALALLISSLMLAACDEDPTAPGEPPGPARSPLGVVEITITGVGTPQMSARASSPMLPASGGPSLNLTPVPGGSGDGTIQLEPVSTSTFTEGRRGIDGVRYLHATFRVRNASTAGTPYTTPRTNLTFVAVETSGTRPGTPIVRLDRFDGSRADSAIAPRVVPTGAVALSQTTEMMSLYPDVLQVYTEAEAASIAAPSGVTNVFPYGFVVRNPSVSTSRTLPASPGPDQFDGLVTFAFRLPLQADQTADPFAISVMFLALDDSDTRVTESLEERDPAARQAASDRAIALGAQVTVLAGGSEAGYPGTVRRICTVRTAGTAASPRTTITTPGAYSRVTVMRPGESLDACAPNWTSGTAATAGLNLPYTMQVYAMDRYGNRLTHVADSLVVATPPEAGSAPAPVVLASGTGSFTITPVDYGNPVLSLTGRRLSGQVPIRVAGIQRVWTGNVSNSWFDGGNWDVGAAPGIQDTTLIPSGLGRYPQLASNVSIGGVSVQNDATLSLGSFNMTATGDVFTSGSGQITSTTGSLFLSGTSRTISGNLPRLRVTGTYSLAGNVTTKGPMRSELGLLRNTSYRLRIDP